MNISKNDGRSFIDHCLTALQKSLDTFLRNNIKPELVPQKTDTRALLNAMWNNWPYSAFSALDKGDASLLRSTVNILKTYGNKWAHPPNNLADADIGKFIYETKVLLPYINADADAIAKIDKIQASYIAYVNQISNNKEMQRIKSHGESGTGAIYVQDHHVAADVIGKKIYCPACLEFVFKSWSGGWDGHAGWKCSTLPHILSPEERKKEYKRRFAHLFKT